MTWDEIIALEPRLRDLHEEALVIREREKSRLKLDDPESKVSAYLSDDYFCHDRTWHNEFKPRMRKLVGHGVGSRSGESDDETFKRLSSDAYLSNPLVSSKAYDIAYETISEALPRCRNCQDDNDVGAALERQE